MLRIVLVCVGRLKAGPERALADRYVARAAVAGRALGLGLELRELPESRARRADDRKAEEADAIRVAVAEAAYFLLDETGRALDSVAFAAMIGAARDEGTQTIALVIGGADGLDPGLRRDASATIAYGAMTWPHQLVRVMAAEQLYRAVTILSGHPYHRA